jgi:hypothetical protein
MEAFFGPKSGFAAAVAFRKLLKLNGSAVWLAQKVAEKPLLPKGMPPPLFPELRIPKHLHCELAEVRILKGLGCGQLRAIVRGGKETRRSNLRV